MKKALENIKWLEDVFVIRKEEQGLEVNMVIKNAFTESIKELEVLSVKDKLAELEKVILDYYLNKGYKINIGGWGFKVNISTFYKHKEIQIMFRKNQESSYETVFRLWEKTTKEMFDKAFEHFYLGE